MAKGCMAVPWGHLVDKTKPFSFRAVWFQSLTIDIKKFPSNKHNIVMKIHKVVEDTITIASC